MSADDSASAIVEAAITIIRDHALHASRIDWPAVTGPLIAAAAGWTQAQGHAAISGLLTKLEDGHSRLRTPGPLAAVAAVPLLLPQSEMRARGVGLVMLPRFGSRAEADRSAYVQAGSRVFATLGALRAVIVDLRQHFGGNMWPMLAALRPLLGGGEIGFFENRGGRRTPWHAPEAPGLPDFSGLPVAVLIGSQTASAGEAVAIAFKACRRTRFLGTPTYGLTMGNTAFPLPGGASLALTTVVELDRAGQRYDGPVCPDVETADPLVEAESWLTEVLR